MEVGIPDGIEHLEDPACNKSLRTCPSVFATTNTYIANVLAGISQNHSKLGRITVQDELEKLWKGGIICNKMKETVVDQEVSLLKRDIFDRQNPMFVGVHPAFDNK